MPLHASVGVIRGGNVEDSDLFERAVASGYLNSGRQRSDTQYEMFARLLKQGEQLLAEDGVTVDWEESVGTAFRIHSPVGSIRAERISCLSDDEVGAAIAFHAIRQDASGIVAPPLGVAFLHSGAQWAFSGGVLIHDHYGRNVPQSAIHVVRLALARKLMYDHKIAMSA